MAKIFGPKFSLLSPVWLQVACDYETRPSALGMSDPIWGPVIHIFVDEKKIEKDKDLDQVNCEYTALRFLNF